MRGKTQHILHLPHLFQLTTMVRVYKRKRADQENYSPDDLKTAVREVSQGRMTIYRAVRIYSIPYSTLYCQVKGTRGKIKKAKGRTTALPEVEEKKLVEGLATLEKWGFALTRKELLELVGKYVNLNKLKTPFKNGVPGADWFISFRRRNNLSIKVPQNIEYARKKATDPFIIYEYFDKLKALLDELDLHDKPDQVWNLDETSMSIDPSKTKVVGVRGKVCTRTISTPGRENTTVLMLASASGIKAPPLIIFKGINIWDQWVAPEGTGFPGTVYAASKKGWMETDIFRNYFLKTLIPFLGDKRPQLIIYDGHATHVDVDIISRAIQENITILKLPPHSSHLLQPLDLSVFKALKVKWDCKLITWQRQHVGCKLPKKLFSQFLGETWKQIDAEVIQNGFKKAGIMPFNKYVVTQDKFDPAALKRWNQRNVPCELEDTDSSTPAVVLESKSNKSVENASEDNPIANDPAVPSTSYSFEDMLLSTVQQRKLPEKTTRRKIISGAEVITCEEVLEELKSKKNPKERRERIPRPKKKIFSKSKQDDLSTSSSDELPSLQDSDGDDEPQFWQQIEQDDAEVNDPVLDNFAISQGRWVIVKYSTKKTVKHFIGQVLEKEEDGWVVKFTKKKNNTFLWPVVDDIDTVQEQDIVRVLTDPKIDRRGSGMIFNFKFEGFSIA